MSILRAAFFALATLTASSALLSCADNKPPAPSAPAEDLSPLPAPAGHVADIFIPAPESTWTRARAMVGGPAVFMPQSFGALAAQLLGLPMTISGEFDHALPVLGALTYEKNAGMHAVLGLHVKAGDRFIDQLTRAENARFELKPDTASGVRLLSRKQASTQAAPVVLGVVGNYLLVGRSIEDLKAIGPYVARTLPAAKAPAEDLAIEIPEAALGGPLLEDMRKSWAEMRTRVEKAGAPVIPLKSPFETLLTVLGDSKHARLALTLDDAAAHARFTLTPKEGDGPAAKALATMSTGDAKPVFDLPEGTQLAMMWRESKDARVEDAPAQAESLVKLLGEGIPDKDKEAMIAAIVAEAKVRGEWVTLGVSLEPTGPAAVLRAPVEGEDEAKKALEGIEKLAKLTGVKDVIKREKLSISISKAVVEDLAGDVRRVRFKRDEKKTEAGAASSELPHAIDLLYFVKGGTLVGAVGEDPKELFRRTANASSSARLGASPPIEQAVNALGSGVSFALVAEPLRLLAAKMGKSAPPTPAPATFAIGRDPGSKELFARLDLATILIQELVKHRDAL